MDWKANTQPLHRLIDEIRAKNPADVENVADARLIRRITGRESATSATCSPAYLRRLSK
jgi:hypothetical protein